MPNPQDEKREPKNPRDPQGGAGSQLNPLRDHVQGEPEEGQASTNAPPTAEPPVVDEHGRIVPPAPRR
jgi:hypothetical protein